ALFGGYERRKLNQPGRRLFRQSVHDTVASHITSPLADGFQHRIISFLTAETFHALPANHSQLWMVAGLTLKLFDQRCLSDSRFSRNEDQLPLALQSLAEIHVQLSHGGLATDHFRRAIDARVYSRRITQLADRRHKLISPPWKSLNELGLFVT